MENRIKKILAIDDNRDNLTILNALIREAFPKAIVLTAVTGQKGLDIAEKEEPDVILLDIIMPEMDGYQTCRKLKANKKLRDIPVVFVTAIKSDKATRIKALESGADAFLSKPIDESELTAQIRAMFKISEANIENKNVSERLATLLEEKTRELVKSEAKFRQIAENVTDVVWMADMDMRTTYISPSVEKMLGESPEAHIRKAVDERFTPDSLKIAHQVFLEELEIEKDPKSDKNRSRIFEIEHYRADGSVIWVSVHSSCLRDENGKFIGFQGVSRDITEKKLVEEKIVEQNILLEKLPEQVPGMIYQYRYHPDGRNYFPYTSSAIWHVYEVTPEEVIEDASKVLSRFHPDDYNRVMDGILESSRTLENWKDEYRVILPKQGERWVSGIAKPEKLEDGSVLWHGYIADITERKNSEERFNQNFKDLLETQRIAQLGTWRLDLATNQVVWSKELYKMYGFDPTIPPPPYTEHMKLFTPESWDRLATALDYTRTSGNPYELELETVTNDGSNGWIWARGESETDFEGNINSLWGAAQDITESKQTENELEKRLLQSVNAISKIGELRDVYTAGHQKKVGDLSCAIGKELGLTKEKIRNLSFGSLLHDVGKFFVPTEILNKPGKITHLEYQIIQTHVEESYNVVKEIDFPKEIHTMIYQHHERLDGSGYPKGVSGDAIILESRILAVADTVEAMTSHRPYRAALGIDAALKEILLHRGTKYDAEVVDICVKLFKEKGYEI